MNTRLFAVYAAIVLLLEGIAALAYTSILPVAGPTFDMQPYQLGIAAALVAAGASIGLAMGYHETELHPVSAIFTGGFGVIGVEACLHYGFYDALVMTAATIVAGILARIADWAIENIELNYYSVDFGRI